MKESYFSKTETLFFKGTAILMIAIHNYLHRYYGLENENSFSEEKVYRFMELMSSLDFYKILTALFAYLGHYGVQIFIFFSAYGLAIQYSKCSVSDKTFIFQRLKKIYFLLGFGIISCILIYMFLGNPISLSKMAVKTILLSSTITSFSFRQMYNMFSGPFWFFALVIQLYILFPFLYRLVTRFITGNKIWILFLISYFLIYIIHFSSIGEHWSIAGNDFGGMTPWGNIIGHLPEVLLGILMATYRKTSFKITRLATASVVFVVSQFNEYWFPLSFLSVTVLLIQSVSWLEKKMKNTKLKNIILYTGSVSMIIFVVNGPLRAVPFAAYEYGLETGVLRLPLYILLLFAVSHVLYLIYNYLTKKLKI